VVRRTPTAQYLAPAFFAVATKIGLDSNAARSNPPRQRQWCPSSPRHLSGRCRRHLFRRLLERFSRGKVQRRLQKLHEPTLVHGRQQGTGKDVDFTTRHRTKFLLVRSLAIISTVIFQAHGGQKGRGAKLTEPYNVGTHLTNSRCGGRDRRCMTNPRCSGRGRRCKSSATVSSTLPENSKASAYRTRLVKECYNFCTFRKYPSKFRWVFVASPYWCCCSMTSCKTRKSAFTPREPQISKARQESGACSDIFISSSFALGCAKPSAMSPGLPIKCDITKQPLLLFL
jgi:hypothetical protein